MRSCRSPLWRLHGHTPWARNRSRRLPGRWLRNWRQHGRQKICKCQAGCLFGGLVTASPKPFSFRLNNLLKDQAIAQTRACIIGLRMLVVRHVGRNDVIVLHQYLVILKTGCLGIMCSGVNRRIVRPDLHVPSLIFTCPLRSHLKSSNLVCPVASGAS